MVQDMPNKSFERSMNHNYMILSKCDFFGSNETKGEDYRLKMLLENDIAGLIPITHRMVNGESKYYYEINSLQSLDRLWAKKEIRIHELRALLLGCINLFERLEEYLLDGSQVIIKPEYIYINVERMEPYFVYYPDYKGDVRIAFMEFIDELLTKIDHADEQAVMLGYQVYRYTRNPNYVLGEIRQMMEHVIVTMTGKNHIGYSTDQYASQESPIDNTADSKVQPIYNVVNEISPKPKENSFGYTYQENAGEDDNEQELQPSKGTGDLIGGIFCILLVITAAGLILSARYFKLFELRGNQELYLFGAIAMAGMSGVIFWVSYVKKKWYAKQVEDLQEDDDEEQQDYLHQGYQVQTSNNAASNMMAAANCNPITPTGQQTWNQFPSSPQADIIGNWENNRGYNKNINLLNKNNILEQMQTCGETVCLGSNAVEERMLRGRINGREVAISLENLPLTIGKLANFADYVIQDNAVSKMHARFEERDGRVYLCDLNSTNGTIKNGVLLDINTPVPVEPGDRIRFGKTSFIYC